jgi:uncharacterized SAM-binding protein YcdF (DUF218 family)
MPQENHSVRVYHARFIRFWSGSMSWFLTNLVSAFLLPPLSLLLLAALGFALWRKRPKLARGLVGLALGVLWLLATPVVAEALLRCLERQVAAVDTRTQAADAIVILGGGSYVHAPEYDGGDTVSEASLLRVRYGATLYRETGKPILTTGGTPLGNAKAEASAMQQVLTQEFHVPVRWVEDASNNTAENARNSYRVLHAAGIQRIYLVTHAWHLPRAMRAFQAAGFEVIPAPTAFTTRHQIDLLAYLPDSAALHGSRIFLHEVIGRIWYAMKSKRSLQH